jgi:hypothetical protein
MKFVSVYFSNPIFTQLAENLKYSIRKFHPNASIDFVVLDQPIHSRRDSEWQRKANHLKLIEWAKRVEDKTVLLDADTLLLQPIEEIFEADFDLCYTKRPETHHIPFNSGVVFVNSGAKEFMQKWLEIDCQMGVDKRLWLKYNKKAFGFNQASFQYCLENHFDLCNIMKVPTYIYNSCDPIDWNKNADKAKIVHIKSTLRDAVLAGKNQFKIQALMQ